MNKYSDMNNWAYYAHGDNKISDLFFICPTVDIGETGDKSMNLANEKVRNNFVGAVNMEIGIYNENSAVYAPFYRQATMTVSLPPFNGEFDKRLDIAYSDIREAFLYYLESCDPTRPLILSSFSQGTIMAKRLLKEFFGDEGLRKRLVAAYLIGWSITEEEYKEMPWIKPAQGETDTGVVIAFDVEAEDTEETIMVKKGVKTVSINPLNWRTDSLPAPKEMNKGACFTDYDGKINREKEHLTGAYIKSHRGTLVPTDIKAEHYLSPLFIHGLPYPEGFLLNGYRYFPDGLIFEKGVYHIYDYIFFYRNLQENVRKRLESYLNKIL